jgi:hypothetical protein
VQRQTVDFANDDELAGRQCGRCERIPQFAVHKDFSLRRQRGLRDSGLSHQTLGTGDHFVAPCFESDSHEEGRDQPEWDADGQRGE